jgi:hypothetical protein
MNDDAKDAARYRYLAAYAKIYLGGEDDAINLQFKPFRDRELAKHVMDATIDGLIEVAALRDKK